MTTLQQNAIASLFALLGLMAFPLTAQAQNLVIQQPALSQRSLDTGLTVPDLGSRTLDNRRYGFDRRRSSLGFPSYYDNIQSFRSGSGSNVGVHIHDFDAIDKALLNQDRPTFGQLPSTDPKLKRIHAYHNHKNQFQYRYKSYLTPTQILRNDEGKVIVQQLPQSIGTTPQNSILNRSLQSADDWLYKRRNSHFYTLDELKQNHSLPVQEK